MQHSEPLTVLIELARGEDAGDPFGFRFAPQPYLIRREGGVFESALFPWSAALLADLDALRRPTRDPVVVQRIGDLLRDFLSRIGWAEQEARILSASRSAREVRITLRFAAAELYALPWELVTVEATGQHLGELPHVLFQYEWPQDRPASIAPEPPPPEGGRILIAWSAAAGAVPSSAHITAIERACHEGHHPFDAQSDVLPNASYQRLAGVLAAASAADRPFAILHLLCHGAESGSTFGLALDPDEAERGATPRGAIGVDADRLRQLLAPFVRTLRLVVLAACDSGNPGALGNHLGSVAQALHRSGIPAVVASRYPLSTAGSIRLTESLYRGLLAQITSLEAALSVARAHVATDPQSLDWSSLQLYGRSSSGDTRPIVHRPYRGLLAFQPEHQRFLFGRDDEVREILGDLAELSRTERPRFLVVAGASGTGKSSLLLAGAIPALMRRADGPAAFVVMRPGSSPQSALTAALLTLSTSAGGPDGSRPRLLIVDQFEEIFTHGTSAELRQSFAQKLWQLASSPDSLVTVFITLRVDFIGQCSELQLDGAGLRLDRVAYDPAHRVFIPQMTTAQLEQAITGPARLSGLALEPGLCSRMLADTGAEPGALPLLEDTLDLLWQKRQGRLLTQAAYDALGGVTGALHSRADSLIDGLRPDQQGLARGLLVRLINLPDASGHGTRRRVVLDELRPKDSKDPQEAARFEELVQMLVQERLLLCTEQESKTCIEVAHEALIRRWERLRRWASEDRESLLALAQVEQWVSEWQARGTLLSRRQVDYAEHALHNRGEGRRDTISRLLRDSRYRLQRRQRVLRWGVLGILAVALTVGVLGTWGITQALQAQELARKTSERARQTRDALRMAAVRQVVAADPTTAIAILREVENLDPAQVHGWLDTVPSFVSPQLYVRTGTLREEGTLRTAGFCRDGERLFTQSREGSVRFWMEDGSLARLLESAQPIRSAAYSDSCKTVIALLQDGAVQVSTRLQPRLRSLPPELGATAIAVSARGDRYAIGAQSGTLRVGSVDREELRLLETHGGDVTALAFSPDGARLLSASRDGAVQLWELDGQAAIALSGPLGTVSTLGFSRDGTRFITGAKDGIARIYRSTGESIGSLGPRRSPIHSASLSPDGTRALTVTRDGSAQLWLVNGADSVALDEPQDGLVLAAAFSPDGTRILTTTDKGITQLFTSPDPRAVRITRRTVLTRRGQPTSSASFSPDGGRIVVASLDGGAQLYVPSRMGPGEIPGSLPTSAALSRDSARLITMMPSPDHSARVWELGGSGSIELRGHQQPLRDASLSADGRTAVTASADHTARIWTLGNGAVVRSVVLTGHRDEVRAAVVSPDGQKVLTASDDHTAVLWSATGERITELRGHSQPVTRAALSADGKHAATGSRDGVVRIWRTRGELVSVLPQLGGEPRSLEFSPDGKRILLTDEGRAALSFAIDGSGAPFRLSLADSPVRTARFGERGESVLLAHADGTAGIRRSNDQLGTTTMPPHREVITAIAASTDLRRILTTSLDGTARIFNAPLWSTIELRGHVGGAVDGTLTPNGAHAVVQSAAGGVRIWNLEVQAVLRSLWEAPVQCLMPNERQELLGTDPNESSYDTRLCSTMRRCLDQEQSAKNPSGYARCLASFRANR